MDSMTPISSIMKNKKKEIGGRKIYKDSIDFLIFYSALTILKIIPKGRAEVEVG